MDQVARDIITLAYGSETQAAFNTALLAALGQFNVTKQELPSRIDKEFKASSDAYPVNSTEALRFLTYLPLQQFRKSPIFEHFLAVLTPEDKKKIPTPTSVWGDQKYMRSSAEETDSKISRDGKIGTLYRGIKGMLFRDLDSLHKGGGVFGEGTYYGITDEVSRGYIDDNMWAWMLKYDFQFKNPIIIRSPEDLDLDDAMNRNPDHNEEFVAKHYGDIPAEGLNVHSLSYDFGQDHDAIVLKGRVDGGEQVIIPPTSNPAHKLVAVSFFTEREDLAKQIEKAFGMKSEKDGSSVWFFRSFPMDKLDALDDQLEQYEATVHSNFITDVIAGSAADEVVTAGMLDFPRKKLPESVWLYSKDDPLPRLQPKLRSMILSEARYRTSKFGAKMVGCMLYGGAATYQYHEGGDIDCSVYIDWEDFKGTEDILQDAFKTVEIPWDKYVVHLFIKPKNQPEQIEVADAYYNVLKDEWELPPLVLPRDFDPEVFFKPLVELAEKKAQKIDILMGEVSREWMRLKKCLRALKEGARDEQAVKERAEVTRSVLLDKISTLCEEFVAIWKGRKKMHDELRKRFVHEHNVGRYERFQFPEVCWKYLDEMGYVDYLKLLAKANESGVIKNLIEQATPQLPDNLPELETELPDEKG